MSGNTTPKPVCQCMDGRRPCANAPQNGSLFCAAHIKECVGSPRSGAEPPYEPQRWNTDPAIYRSLNCYAYAANYLDPATIEKCRRNNSKDCRGFFPQPGARSGARNALNARERRNCPSVEALMRSDIPELTRSSFHERCPQGSSKIALVSHKGEDYHFYRQDADGMWSHKDGSNKVKNFDALKRRIFNPEFAARDYRHAGSDLNYSDFCGFYCVPRDRPIQLAQGGAAARRSRKQRAGRRLATRRRLRSGIA